MLEINGFTCAGGDRRRFVASRKTFIPTVQKAAVPQIEARAEQRS